MKRRRSPFAGFCCLAIGSALALNAAFLSSVWAEAGTALRDQLSGLAREHGIELKGLNEIQDEPAKEFDPDGDIQAQLAGLLNGHNYVLVTDPSGRVTLVRILRRLERFKAALEPAPPSLEAPPRAEPWQAAQEVRTKGKNRKHVIRTTRSAGAHYIETTLIGPNGEPVELFLQVDTGADAIMLPVSMIEVLGFDREEDLEAGSTTTSEGWVPTERGSLWLVQVESAEAEQVAVRFIEDRYFRHEGVLGRSFLRHFDYLLDDSKAELTLSEK